MIGKAGIKLRKAIGERPRRVPRPWSKMQALRRLRVREIPFVADEDPVLLEAGKVRCAYSRRGEDGVPVIAIDYRGGVDWPSVLELVLHEIAHIGLEHVFICGDCRRSRDFDEGKMEAAAWSVVMLCLNRLGRQTAHCYRVWWPSWMFREKTAREILRVVECVVRAGRPA